MTGAARQPGQPGHLGRESLAGFLALGGLGHPGEPGGPGGQALVGRGQRRGAGRVQEQAGDHAQRVVAGGPRARPVRRQPFRPGQDLLGAYPQAAGALREPPQVATRVGEPVRMVHPQPVDDALAHQAEDHLVGGLEHRGVLDPDRDQRADVEEPPPVEVRRGQLPVGQPVMLGVEQLRQRQALRAGPDGQHMVEVPEHRIRAAGVYLQVAEAVAGRAAQDRHEQPAVLGLPVNVEPARERRPGAVPEHRPERPVERFGNRDGHVVGHDVHDQAQPGRAEPCGHGPERGLATQVLRHPGVVHDVVPVPGARGGLEDR